jgi:hypothetical protein
MLVYFDQDQNTIVRNMGRYHPWTVTMGTPGGRYIDFKKAPDAIREGLEDLGYIRGTVLETAFVSFFRRTNSPPSAFETNDFGLRPLKENQSVYRPSR